ELPSGDPKEGPLRQDQCPLEVALTPEKAEGREGPAQLFGAEDGERAAACEGPRGLGRKRLHIGAVRCDVSVQEDDRQEWTFTLYDFDNSGKVTREDVSSLMHTIYEVVDASINHSSGGSKTLRVKLSVSPEPSGKRKDGPPAGQDREPTRCRAEAEPAEDPRVADRRLSAHVRQEHHAKAAHLQSRSRSQEPDAHVLQHRRSQVLADHAALAAEPVRALDTQPRPKGQEKPLLRSPKGTGKPPGLPGGSKPGRASGHYLLAQAPPDAHHPPQPPPYGHKRYRQKGRE
ncbi:PREDICTED: protein naked cuticle homolog 2-like, partial [Propithecus coquereli]|uniref:protein naked cuticle homolog 2-like n=1 Tax=Propithecus coquereli TaxID=379532 RepID=UPI00063F3CFE